MHTIQLIGEVNEALVTHFFTKITKLESELPADSVVTIELSSWGGSAYDGLAIAGRMQASPLTLHLKAYGQVMSAATAILAAADHRSCSRETWIMVHDSRSSAKGTVNQVANYAAQMEAEEQQWANLLEYHTGTPEDVWRKLSKKTTYLTATKALQLGLIDAIHKGKGRK